MKRFQVRLQILVLIALTTIIISSLPFVFSNKVAFRDDFEGEQLSDVWSPTIVQGAVFSSDGILDLYAEANGSSSVKSEVVVTGDKYNVSYRVLPLVFPVSGGVCAAISAASGLTLAITGLNGDWCWSYWVATTKVWNSTSIPAAEGEWYVVKWIVLPAQTLIMIYDDNSAHLLGSYFISFKPTRTNSLTLATFSWSSDKSRALWDYIEIVIEQAKAYQRVFLVIVITGLVADIGMLPGQKRE